MMGYSEFCTAVMNLAVRKYPEMSNYDAMKTVLTQLEDKFMQENPLSPSKQLQQTSGQNAPATTPRQSSTYNSYSRSSFQNSRYTRT